MVKQQRVYLVCCRLTNDRKTKLAVKTELSFANSQLDLLKEELEGINSTFDVYQFDRCGIYYACRYYGKYVVKVK